MSAANRQRVGQLLDLSNCPRDQNTPDFYNTPVAVTPELTNNSNTPRPTILYAAASVVSLVGLADAIYLAVEHVAGRSVKCTIVSGCSEVLSSQYATVGGVPLALVGAIAYFVVFTLATLAAFGYKGAGKLLTFVVGLMLITSLWLVYLQAFVIRAFCQYCLLSALVTFVLTGLVVAIVARASRP